MHLFLKQELDCSPDAAWKALRSPEVFRAVASPLMTFVSTEPTGSTWTQGEHPVEARLLGIIPVGTQVIDLTFTERDGVRFVHDTGEATSGALSIISYWHHTMAVSATPDGRTLFRDRLLFDAEPVSLAVWPALWAFWQWRGRQIAKLAPSWR